MTENSEMLKQNHNQEGPAAAPNTTSEKVRYGAPDGPRKKRRGTYNGHEPLEYPGHEAVAQYLATPESLREFKSFSDIANHFHVSRMTIHRWKHDEDVLQRAHWLSTRNKIAGDLMIRCAWPQIMKKLRDSALGGNIAAIKSCEARVWPEDKHRDTSGLSETSLGELLDLQEEERMKHGKFPSWCDQENVKEAAERKPAAETPASEEGKSDRPD